MLKILAAFSVALLLVSQPIQADDFDSAGVKIHYTVQGSGEPVILIHGLYASGQTNWGLPGIIAELAQHYQVIALDCRGHGSSDKPTGEGDYGIKMADDVVRLMDHLHLASANLIGYSMGGMITLKLAVTHPERVHSAILGGMGWLKEGSPLQHSWESLGERKSGGVQSAVIKGFAEFAVTEDQVKALKMPIQVVVGERDPCRKMYVEPLLQIRPDITAHVIPAAGHITCVMKPEFKTELAAALSQNLAAH